MPNYMCYFGGGGAGGGNCSMKLWTYDGNSVDNRNIDIGVDLAAKSFVYIVIKGTNAKEAVHRVEYGQGDLTMVYGQFADYANNIQLLTSTGFQVGTSVCVNLTGVTYRVAVFWVD